MLNKEAVFHAANGIWAYQDEPNTLVVILKAKKGDIKSIQVKAGGPFMIRKNDNWKQGDEWTKDNVDWVTEKDISMEKYVSDEYFDYYKARITTKTKRVQYIFFIESTFNEQLVYGSSYFHKPEDWFFRDCFTWGYLDEGNIPQTPKWVSDVVWYQVFPERFNNGNKDNDPKNVLEWESKKHPTSSDFFGGDLEGVIEKLDYIQQLGFTGIFMTPVFKSASIHKYDTISYSEIDPAFGDETIFQNLINECKKRNIKVMIDGVFNHIGALSPEWQDVMKHKENSRFKDWFKINDFSGVDFLEQRKKDNIIQKWRQFAVDYPYETFAFSPNMPKLNWNNKELREFLFKSIEKWTQMGIDGWRLDVAGEPSFKFWREFRNRVKDINPDIYIMGEIMYDAKPFLEGDMFDSVMNYKLRDAIVDYVVDGITKDQFEMILSKNIVRYHRTIQESMFNLLDSHDKPRLFTLLNKDVDKYLFAYSLLFIMSGSPCVYYGCEIGLEGKHDPDNRRCMIWDETRWNKTIQSYFKKLIDMRNEHKALRVGEYKILETNHKNISLVVRYTKGDTLYCFANGSDKKETFNKENIIKESSLATKIEKFLKTNDIILEKYSVKILSL